jgi:hypothetical protein
VTVSNTCEFRGAIDDSIKRVVWAGHHDGIYRADVMEDDLFPVERVAITPLVLVK